ncbi:hypothetical protein BDV95DRAFT_670150 [Massariosphaeria phaeospora]|uniref:Uncharacterized protein n=1 Tax=Massariosphaeria phaeospora TaxID=100035 RepID=A0A7C8I9I6_9PLEO|nr:hypothetical protein BDV95DRAFT_670150 [Massariosphaeria phaeospora]
MVQHTLDLPRLYGVHYGGKWSPFINNIITNEDDHRGHHCPVCKTEPKRICFEKLHLAFCCALVTGANGQQQFCGIRFAPRMGPGCKKQGHRYSDDANLWLYAASRGQPHNMPDFIPHEQTGWIQPDRGQGSKKRAAGQEAKAASESNILSTGELLLSPKQAAIIEGLGFVSKSQAHPKLAHSKEQAHRTTQVNVQSQVQALLVQNNTGIRPPLAPGDANQALQNATNSKATDADEAKSALIPPWAKYEKQKADKAEREKRARQAEVAKAHALTVAMKGAKIDDAKTGKTKASKMTFVKAKIMGMLSNKGNAPL